MSLDQETRDQLLDTVHRLDEARIADMMSREIV